MNQAEINRKVREHNRTADKHAPDLTYEEAYGPSGPLSGLDER